MDAAVDVGPRVRLVPPVNTPILSIRIHWQGFFNFIPADSGAAGITGGITAGITVVFSFFFCCNSHHRVPSRRIIPSGRILGLICHRTSFLTGSLRIFPDPSGILNREARQRFGQVNRNRSRWMDNGTITAITTGAGGILSLSLSFSIQDRSVLPGKFHGERSFGLDLDTLAPEFDFRVDGSMETEGRRLGVERRNRRVVTHLLANDPTSSNHNKINTQTSRKKSHLHYINGNNPDDPINPSIPSFLPSPSQKTRSTGILKSTHKSN